MNVKGKISGYPNRRIAKIKEISCFSLVFLILSFAAISSGLNAGSLPVITQSLPVSAIKSFPGELGEVIYRCNEDNPNQLFIIGISHRDTMTGTNGPTTVQAQVEVYRIAEWLIRNRGLELLLPEGFFSEDQVNSSRNSISSLHERNGRFFDTETLEARLRENMPHVNAEMLLSESYAIHIRQVEDFTLYSEVRSKLRSLEKLRYDALASLFIQADLDYLQDLRTAAMLQKIPDIIDNEYSEGTIHSKEALFTIGLAHISGIIRYFEQKKIAIESPAFTSFKDYAADVNLLINNFGVTIIIPRSLSADRQFLLASREDDI